MQCIPSLCLCHRCCSEIWTRLLIRHGATSRLGLLTCIIIVQNIWCRCIIKEWVSSAFRHIHNSCICDILFFILLFYCPSGLRIELKIVIKSLSMTCPCRILIDYIAIESVFLWMIHDIFRVMKTTAYRPLWARITFGIATPMSLELRKILSNMFVEVYIFIKCSSCF